MRMMAGNGKKLSNPWFHLATSTIITVADSSATDLIEESD